MRLDHPTKQWTFDPLTVQYSLIQDIDQGEHRSTSVDRTRAEEVARQLQTPLPNETELRHMMEDRASATS